MMFSRDRENIRPIDLLMARAKDVDPLKIPVGLECALFIPIAQIMQASIFPELSILELALSLYRMTYFFKEFSGEWKPLAAWFGQCFVGPLPFIGLPFRIFEIACITKSSLQGLRSSWNNLSYRPKQAVVRGLLAGFTGWVFWKDFLSYLKFTRAFYEYCRDDLPSSTFTPEQFPDAKRLTPEERLTDPAFNPAKVKDALFMICPDCSAKDLYSEDRSFYVKPYRKLQQQFHPDRFKGNPEISQRLNVAKDTLDQYTERKPSSSSGD